jgi:hypothetical protein
MFKKIALALTFVVALSMAGLSTPDTSEARWGRYYGARPNVSYYWGRPAYYGYYRPYRTYYRSYYGPRIYRPYYNAYYGSGYYYGPIYR